MREERHRITAKKYDAAIFDLDGVVTDTAGVHAEAWKRMFDEFLSRDAARRNVPFRPFDIDGDYRLHVDGKPRVDGVRSFLRSRGIDLPEGRPDDPAGTETVQGLGTLKNEYFLHSIRERGVAVYASTVDFIHAAKRHGLKTAIISSSRNCAMILNSANLRHLFDASVDGTDSEAIGIKGKPAPDIFLEAARQLRVKPARAIVVEDAIAGVQAGRAGAFGLVIGVARKGDAESLLGNGADTAVEDLSQIEITDGGEAMHALPSALERFEEIAGAARGKRIAVFLDYDGTLTPIVETPDRAIMSEEMRAAVVELSRCCTVGIISGRDLEDVRDKVKIDSIVYAGSHGFDVVGPEGLHVAHQVGTEFLPVLDEAEGELLRELGSIPGVLVERKRFAIAVHYRLVAQEKVESIEEAVDRVSAGRPELRKARGKKIFELQPAIDWHKGKAVLSLLGALRMDGTDVLPIYMGDDVTDEDAFRALRGRGIGIVVWDEPYETAATYSLHDPDEVGEFLLKVASFRKGGRHGQ
ncbi:MAG: trehalose-phosphatase [bacterium]|nr:trehalose-phosphatase [bacterium]